MICLKVCSSSQYDQQLYPQSSSSSANFPALNQPNYQKYAQRCSALLNTLSLCIIYLNFYSSKVFLFFSLCLFLIYVSRIKDLTLDNQSFILTKISSMPFHSNQFCPLIEFIYFFDGFIGRKIYDVRSAPILDLRNRDRCVTLLKVGAFISKDGCISRFSNWKVVFMKK